MATLVAMLTVLTIAWPLPAGQAASVDYVGFYQRGVTFEEFLANARQLRDEWQANATQAKVDEALLARARALHAHWRLLIVAEDWCHDSLYTVPAVAKLAAAAPDTLSIRIVDSTVGRPVMEAHRTADGRAATPTIVVLDEAGTVKGTLTERPAALNAYVAEHQAGLSDVEVRELKHTWYGEDGGRHAIAELLDAMH
jgi:hypothetical protein